MTPMERAGKRNLEGAIDLPKPATRARCYFVRIVYRSMGDELLAVEVGPLACLAAEALLGKHRREIVWVGKGLGDRGHRRSYVDRSKTGAEGAYMITRTKFGETVTGDTDLCGARLVVFPSQDPNPIRERTEQVTTVLGAGEVV